MSGPQSLIGAMWFYNPAIHHGLCNLLSAEEPITEAVLRTIFRNDYVEPKLEMDVDSTDVFHECFVEYDEQFSLITLAKNLRLKVIDKGTLSGFLVSAAASTQASVISERSKQRQLQNPTQSENVEKSPIIINKRSTAVRKLPDFSAIKQDPWVYIMKRLGCTEGEADAIITKNHYHAETIYAIIESMLQARSRDEIDFEGKTGCKNDEAKKWLKRANYEMETAIALFKSSQPTPTLKGSEPNTNPPSVSSTSPVVASPKYKDKALEEARQEIEADMHAKLTKGVNLAFAFFDLVSTFQSEDDPDKD